jgi:ribosomal protein S18 acetylase RimI-like enzyme
MLIRKAKEEDFEQYFKLSEKENQELKKYYLINGKTNKQEFKKKYLNRIKHKNWFILLAEEKNHVQGYLVGTIMNLNKNGFICSEKEIGYIDNAFLQSKYRNKGYFKQMLNQFEALLKNRKIKFCKLNVSLKNPIKKGYKKLGFQEQEWVMLKRLR